MGDNPSQYKGSLSSNGVPSVAVDGINGIKVLEAFTDPQISSTSPTFIDTHACRCTLQGQSNQPLIWRCLGNTTEAPYDTKTTTGKFYYTQGKKSGDFNISPTRPISDATYPPDNSTTFTRDQSGNLQTLNGNGTLSIYDRACTGQNDTTESERWYNIFYQTGGQNINYSSVAAAASDSATAAPTKTAAAAAATSTNANANSGSNAASNADSSPDSDSDSDADSDSGFTKRSLESRDLVVRQNNLLSGAQAPVSAFVCLGGSTPILLQNATSWDAHGCQAGFLCPRNSINALPQYCVPDQACQAARLAGRNCPQAQGIYEPQLCPQGYYCPQGAKDKIACPTGHFCPPGSVSPLVCTGFASCPEKQYYNAPILPIILLLIWDVLLVLIFIFAKWQGNRASHRVSHQSGMISYLNKKRHGRSGYQDLEASPGASETMRPKHSRGNSSVSDIGDSYEMEGRLSLKNGSTLSPDPYAGGRPRAASEASTIYGRPEPEEEKHELDAFVASLSRCIQGSSFGLSFNFNNLSYQPKGTAKPILSDISGQVRAGSCVAVMGGSGAGKSTFVNVLMGKRPHTSGQIKINGVAGKMKQYKKIIGFVPQDDVLLTELTVRENILHSARIRLPANWSDRQIQEHVDILLQCLKLDHVRDNIVGGVDKPGVSGGQRKRVSIGMELAACPLAIFLDEPTSGLDATAAGSIMGLLKALSRLGITIVTIIHQPRQEIFEGFDDLILLGLGRMIYEGPTMEVTDYLGRMGFHFPRSQNPADVIMDIINGEGRHYKRNGDVSIQSLIDGWHHEKANRPPLPTIVPPQDEVTALKRSIRRRGAYWPKQIYLCWRRAMLQQYRMATSFWFEMGVATLAGLLIGLAENKLKGIDFQGIFRGDYTMLSAALNSQSLGQLALLVAIAVGLVAASPGVKVFGEEKLVYYREAASGHNRFAYYTGKVLSTFPRMVLGAVHFTTLFMLLAVPRMHWLEALLVNFLYYWCIYGIASVVSFITRREDGPLIAVMMTLIIGTLSGVAPTLATVTSWHLEWLWRASPGTWLAEYYYVMNVLPWQQLYDVEMTTAQTFGYNLNWTSLDVLALAGIGLAYRMVAYLTMRLFNRQAQQ